MKLHDLEEKVDELQDQIRKSHTRLTLFSESIMGAAGGSRAEIEFKNEMSSAFLLTRALFVVDGQVQYSRQDDSGALAEQKEIPISSGSMPAGDHTINVSLTFQGNGYGVFSYLRGYKFEVKNSHAFTATDGRAMTITAIAFEKGGVTTPLEQRPAVQWQEKAQGGSVAARLRRRPVMQGQRSEPPAAQRSCALRRFRAVGRARCAGRRRELRCKDLDEIGREIPAVRASVEHARVEQHLSAEQRLANGELLYRLNDFPHAIVVLNEILLEYKDTPSYPDALWLLGETYYAAHDYLSANTAYKELVTHGAEPRYQTYFGKALARMVDVLDSRERPPSDLAFIFDKFNLVPPTQVDAALLYAKGKAYFRMKGWNEAGAAFSQVAANTTYTHQARYYQGLVALKVAQGTADAGAKATASAGYKQAIEAFRAVTVLPPDTTEHRHVIDLAWMAIARLFYEMEQYGRSSEAYSKIGRDSPEFDTMLFELGWVYVRMETSSGRSALWKCSLVERSRERVHRRRDASPGRPSPPGGRFRSRARALQGRPRAVRPDARQGGRLSRLDEGRGRLLRPSLAAAAGPPRSERPAPPDRPQMGA